MKSNLFLGNIFDFNDEKIVQQLQELGKDSGINEQIDMLNHQIAILEEAILGMQDLADENEVKIAVISKVNRLKNKRDRWVKKMDILLEPEELIKKFTELGLNVFAGERKAVYFVGKVIGQVENYDPNMPSVLIINQNQSADPSIIIDGIKAGQSKYRKVFGKTFLPVIYILNQD